MAGVFFMPCYQVMGGEVMGSEVMGGEVMRGEGFGSKPFENYNI